MKLGIIGTGNMGEALIAGLLAKKVLRSTQISGYDVSRARLNTIGRRYKIRTTPSLKKLVQSSTILLIAIKPQQIRGLLGEIKTLLKKEQLILSIAAGINVKQIEKELGKNRKIVRLMPNTPALIGEGATSFYLNRNCSNKDKRKTELIFSAVGEVFEVKKESLLDAVTGLSGSGPAYVYQFIEALITGGQKQGLKREVARQLALQTVIGATELVKRTKKEPKELIKKVTSKGGTTLAGLKVLKQKKFSSIVQQCIGAATRRAKELGK